MKNPEDKQDIQKIAMLIKMDDWRGYCKYCIDHDLDYAQTASRFQMAYWQVYNWVKKYKAEGEEGLSDRRGKRKTTDELDETEKLKRRIQSLERELEDERMKNEL